MSRAEKGWIFGTADWGLTEYALAERFALSALRGVGDETRQRAFRMNVTYCIHRAVSAEERAIIAQSPAWCNAPGGLAGGPVEVLWTRGIPHREAAMPCHNPGRLVISASRPDLWLPSDCGRCPPCLARAAILAVVRNRTSLFAQQEKP